MIHGGSSLVVVEVVVVVVGMSIGSRRFDSGSSGGSSGCGCNICFRMNRLGSQ